MNEVKQLGINGLFLRKPGTGIGQVTKYFLEEFARLEESVGTYIVYTDDPSLNAPLRKGGSIFYIKPWWKRDDRIRKLLWEHIQLPKRALHDNVTHFLSLYQAPTEFPKDVNHVMITHDMIPEIFPKYRANARSRFIWNLTKRGITRAKKVVAVSAATKRDVIEYTGTPEEKISVIYPSINPLFFNESTQQESYQSSVLKKYQLTPGYLYHGGGLEIRKNTETLLTAYAAWCQTAADKKMVPPLVISGFIHEKSNTLATDVRGLITRLHLEQKVQLLGFVPDEDLPALYAKGSLFVFRSLYEGFGMPLVEALSQGTAVMASRNSSLGEVGGEVVFWEEGVTKENLEKNSTKAQGSSLEEKSIRRLQARNFSSWSSFTKKVTGLLIQ